VALNVIVIAGQPIAGIGPCFIVKVPVLDPMAVMTPVPVPVFVD